MFVSLLLCFLLCVVGLGGKNPGTRRGGKGGNQEGWEGVLGEGPEEWEIVGDQSTRTKMTKQNNSAPDLYWFIYIYIYNPKVAVQPCFGGCFCCGRDGSG